MGRAVAIYRSSQLRMNSIVFDDIRYVSYAGCKMLVDGLVKMSNLTDIYLRDIESRTLSSHYITARVPLMYKLKYLYIADCGWSYGDYRMVRNAISRSQRLNVVIIVTLCSAVKWRRLPIEMIRQVAEMCG